MGDIRLTTPGSPGTAHGSNSLHAVCCDCNKVGDWIIIPSRGRVEVEMVDSVKEVRKSDFLIHLLTDSG